jgi:hypothetical protein
MAYVRFCWAKSQGKSGSTCSLNTSIAQHFIYCIYKFIAKPCQIWGLQSIEDSLCSFWVKTLCSVAHVYQCFEETHCLHHHGQELSCPRWHHFISCIQCTGLITVATSKVMESSSQKTSKGCIYLICQINDYQCKKILPCSSFSIRTLQSYITVTAVPTVTLAITNTVRHVYNHYITSTVW